MWDTICHLPLSSDLISLATHPYEPVIAIGLASGHVQALRIPTPDEPISTSTSTSTDLPANKPSKSRKGLLKQPSRSALSHHLSEPSPSSGYGTLTTLWRTHRHKGSARALAFSTDGSTLFSAGTDGLLKAAHALSGRVLGKVAVPGKAGPSTLCALNAQTLLLGDDEGAVHVFPLSETSRSFDAQEKLSAHVPAAQPSATHKPHVPRADDVAVQDPNAGTEPITSITPLPATAASASGAARAWVSTAGGTLAACDIVRGPTRVSIEQGGASGEELLASACCVLATPASSSSSGPPPAKSIQSTKSASTQSTATPAPLLIAGDSAGLLSLWPRGAFEDRIAGVRVRAPPPASPSIDTLADGSIDDAGIESLATLPLKSGGALAALGLGSGGVRFVRVDGGATSGWDADLAAAATSSSANTSANQQGKKGKSAGQQSPGDARRALGMFDAARKGLRKAVLLQKGWAPHDDRSIDGVSCVGFDSAGRLVSGGGALVKVWAWSGEGEQGVDVRGPGAGGTKGVGRNGVEDVDEGSEDEDMEDEGGEDEDEDLQDEDSEEEDDDEEDSDDSDDDETSGHQRRKRRRRETMRDGRKRRRAGGDHGVSLVAGLD